MNVLCIVAAGRDGKRGASAAATVAMVARFGGSESGVAHGTARGAEVMPAVVLAQLTASGRGGPFATAGIATPRAA